MVVGESLGHEVAITVTGLKPNHFYNIRVVAMGPNNFQAASPVIRLRTFGKDGKPDLGNARLPTNFVDDDAARGKRGDDSDDSDAHFSSSAAVESAPVLDNASNTREGTGTAPAQRRNTINRRHSPSVASMDQPIVKIPILNGPEPSLDELNRKFEEIRREIDENLSTFTKDEVEFQQQEEELKKEKDRKRLGLKEKEELTTQLKAIVRSTMEQMRASEKERVKKEQQLRDKESKKSKVRDNISKHEHDFEAMKREREGFQAQKSSLEGKRDSDMNDLDRHNAELQENCAELELDLKDKGKQLQDMKEAREKLPGANDEQGKENDERSRREWENLRQNLHSQLVAETKRSHQLDHALQALAERQLLLQQAMASFYAQTDPSAADMDMAAQPSEKRLSHGSTSAPREDMSPPGHFVPLDTNMSPAQLGRGGFAPGPFIDIQPSHDELQSEAEFKAAGGPLSPSAQDYLPSGILDYEGSESRQHTNAMLPESVAAGDADPQSPMSSTRSFSLLSSPHGSSHNLPFPQYTDNVDGRSINLSPDPAPSRFTNLLSSWQRSKTSKAVEDGGPPLGSLKPGQSQSFPRGFEDIEAGGPPRRKISFSLKSHRNSIGLDGNPSQPLSNARMPSRNWLNPFGGFSNAGPTDREFDQPRPASIASTDMPRPSTDSGSIWGTPGDSKSRMWSGPDGRWASQAGSRRPSLHGSPALTTSLASAEDVILDGTEMRNPESLGVIGSRPPASISAQSLSQRLNPNAPTFRGNMTSFFRNHKEKAKDRQRDTKDRGMDVTGPYAESYQSGLGDSPTNPRTSRDTFSVHTQTSVSESRESLTLDNVSSHNSPNTGGLLTTTSSKEPDNVNSIKKLLRKGSSGKFSLSGRLGKDSGLFKKGPGSATNSDRNASADHRSSIGDLDEVGEDVAQLGRSFDSVASSPSLGPAKPKDSKEGRMSNWRFMKKKGKETANREKESMEMDRSTEDEPI